LGATPAALLAGGGNLERDFELQAQPPKDGLQWVLAAPRQRDAGIAHFRVGFAAGEMRQIELLDSFGQRTLLQFSAWKPNAVIDAARFRFTPPAGADLIEQ
jgi:outer membrane lipoprotein carrier protein